MKTIDKYKRLLRKTNDEINSYKFKNINKRQRQLTRLEREMRFLAADEHDRKYGKFLP